MASMRVRDLTVTFGAPPNELAAVSQISLDLTPGQITGLVGESGSGKTTLGLALLNAIPPPGRVTSGSVRVDGLGDMLTLPPAALRRVRGAQLGYVFQAAQNSLNPLRPVGRQLLDLGRSHGEHDRRRLLRRASGLLEDLGLDPDQVLAAYQHELSGGSRQRVDLVFALLLSTSVLVLDEPTTALDVISQAAVLRVIKQAQEKRQLSILAITHDLRVAGELADRIAVMYAGHLVEEGPTEAVLADPRHPYTRGLLDAMPRLSGDPGLARPLPGRPPELTLTPRRGCAFRERCPVARLRCAEIEPAVTELSDRRVACHAIGPDQR